MPLPTRHVACLAFGALALAGCSVDAFTYTIDRYGTVRGTYVRLGCQDAYEVFDRPATGTLLVVTNAVNEGLASCANGLAALPKPERMRRVASIFLEERKARPGCRVVRGGEISELHSEYEYSCPDTPAPRLRPGR